MTSAQHDATPRTAVNKARATLAAIQRHRPDDGDAITAAREALNIANAEASIRALPQLPTQTRAYLAAILLAPLAHATDVSQ